MKTRPAPRLQETHRLAMPRPPEAPRCPSKNHQRPQKLDGEPDIKHENGNSKTYAKHMQNICKTYAKHMHHINNIICIFYLLLNIVQYSTYLGCTRMYYISSWLSRFHRKANMTYLFSQLLLLGEEIATHSFFFLLQGYAVELLYQSNCCILHVRVIFYIFSEPRDFYNSLP